MTTTTKSRSSLFKLRFTKDERDILNTLAKRDGSTASEYVRRLVRQDFVKKANIAWWKKNGSECIKEFIRSHEQRALPRPWSGR